MFRDDDFSDAWMETIHDPAEAEALKRTLATRGVGFIAVPAAYGGTTFLADVPVLGEGATLISSEEIPETAARLLAAGGRYGGRWSQPHASGEPDEPDHQSEINAARRDTRIGGRTPRAERIVAGPGEVLLQFVSDEPLTWER